MGRIVPNLLARYQRIPVNPVIVEFDTLAHATDLFTTLSEMVSKAYLTSFSGPIDFMSMLGGIAFNRSFSLGEIQSFSETSRERNRPFDRIASRFQNTLLSMKLLSRMKMVAVPLPADDIDEVAQWSETETVYEDKACYAFQSVPPEHVFVHRNKPFTTTFYTKKVIGASQANAEGFAGSGITVAVPDTGGAPSHPQNFRMKYFSVMKEKGQFKDKNGHGEWCVSCIGGQHIDEKTLNVPVEGMAPGCTLIGIKCLGFVIGTGFQSDIIQAMEYSANQGADIVSLSLGSDSMPQLPEDDPQIKAVDDLVAQGIIPVIAAGNSGPAPSTIGTPGCAPNALTIGAWDPIRNQLANFSSRGPTLWGDIKPDVINPGVDIYSGCVGLLDTVGDRIPNRYSILSGTSMATPHSAGLLACVQQYYAYLGQKLTVQMIKTVAQTYGTVKANDVGWGFMTWQWFKDYAESEGWA